MLEKELGNTGRMIPAIGLGTWGIGGFETADHSKDEMYVEVLKKALSIGYRHIDTAEYYGNGHTEELVGIAIREEGIPREELFIVSKVWPTHLRETDLLKSLNASLKRLDVDYLDLYLIHWPNPDIPLEETLRAMAKAVDQGMVKYIGVSNFDRNILEKAISLSSVPIVCNQVRYNILDRTPEKTGLLSFCQEKGITLTAYSPLNRNVLDSNAKRTLESIAKNHNATIYQIMLAWLLSKERVVAIPKASSEKHLMENLKACEIKLTTDEIAILDSIQ